MKIGIDVSQLAYQNTGVANYLQHLVLSMVNDGKQHEYVLFFSSLRGSLPREFIEKLPPSVIVCKYKLPPTVLDLLWNKLHIWPVELFVGNVDVFITSDWTEPPTKKANKATILYDLVVYKYPEETAEVIRKVQKRKLKWVKKETDAVLCISESTKKDAMNILGLSENKLHVIYPGV